MKAGITDYFPWWVTIILSIFSFYTGLQLAFGSYQDDPRYETQLDKWINFLHKEPYSWSASLFMFGVGIWFLYLAYTEYTHSKIE